MRSPLVILAAASWLVAAAVVACSRSDEGGSSVPPYTYDACSPEPEDLCPGQAQFQCALATITAAHNACNTADDCVMANGPDAIGPDASGRAPLDCVSFCAHGVVTQGHEEAYLDEVLLEAYKYCQAARCYTYANCSYADCVEDAGCREGTVRRPKNAVPACIDGGCTLVEGVLRVDAGT